MNIEDIKKNLLKDPAFRAAYERKDKADLALRISFEIERARLTKGLTQQELAKKMSTHQPSIARAERGVALPSLTFLQQMAEALNTYIIEPQFAFLHEERPVIKADSRGIPSQRVCAMSDNRHIRHQDSPGLSINTEVSATTLNITFA